MCDSYDIENVMPGKSKKNRKDLLSELRSMEDDTYIPNSGYSSSSFLPSSMLKDNVNEDKKHKKKNK